MALVTGNIDDDINNYQHISITRTLVSMISAAKYTVENTQTVDELLNSSRHRSITLCVHSCY